ncbi:MAG: helix-turn-helix domain-containing protein [Pseudobutyrivibrio ruminis]|uniref:helix-turn-helix transcriptional regulator n=1 Tax=Pseudobutyrivibrio ruminis TaxID=46206 RepID=UPI0026EC9EEE|nr:AraC family transcriptional regulator [Pseudobutyrivibrio ruminis]MBE5912637.1 helix-turn-helix domain-containing protein [Pseudobutyrivibrio ruminis]
MYIDYKIIEASVFREFKPSEHYYYILILRGNGVCKLPHNSLTIKPHELVAFPLNTPAEFTFETSAMLGIMELHDTVATNPSIIHISHHKTQLIRDLFYKAIDLSECNDVYYEPVRRAMDMLIFEAIHAELHTSLNTNPCVLQMIYNINKNFADINFDLHSEIEKTGYSLNHFRKLFKNSTGIPPIEFLNHRRIEYAKELIKHTKIPLTVKEISINCGYNDAYYFSRLFKKMEGISPKEYINRNHDC